MLVILEMKFPIGLLVVEKTVVSETVLALVAMEITDEPFKIKVAFCGELGEFETWAKLKTKMIMIRIVTKKAAHPKVMTDRDENRSEKSRFAVR